MLVVAEILFVCELSCFLEFTYFDGKFTRDRIQVEFLFSTINKAKKKMILKKLTYILIVAFSSLFTHAQLSGVYTIGGTNPNYTTIALAVSNLQAVGVSGPVTFNIRNGTYFEQITLAGWAGASSTNLVTFQSESGDSTSVVWQFWGTSNTTIPLTVNGADHIKFNKIAIRTSLSGNFRKCVRIISSVSDVAFHNCSFRGAQFGNNSDENIVEVNGGFGVNFDKCHFSFGFNAITIIDNFSGVRNNHSFITNCEFHNFRESAIFAQYFADITIEDNYMFSNGTSGVTGIEFQVGSGMISVLRNRMDLTVTLTGIGANMGISCTQTEFTAGSIIANNMIHLKGIGSSGGGVRLNNSLQDTCLLDFVYNTVRLEGDVNSDYPAVYGGTHGTRILNNILTSTNTVNLLWSQNADSIDYNILYSNGLVDWTQTINYLGPNNYSLDPLFMSTSDLHVIPTLASNQGNFMSSVTTDIDGDMRDPLNPDIGADEIASYATDAMISAIVSPASNISYCATVDNIEVVLSNIGNDTLTSCQVILKINGAIVNTFIWTGSLPTGVSDTLDLGTFPYQSGVSYEFTVYSSLPNGIADQMQLNDTIILSNFHTGLSGVYTLGGIAPNFSSFAALQLALEKGGMCGPVVVNVRNGIYNEYLLLDGIAGSSEINTLTIQGESGDSNLVTLNASNSSGVDFTLRIEDMRFVTIKDMRIRNSGAINNRVLYMLRVSDIKLESLVIQGYSCSGCSSQTQYGLYGSLVDSNLVVDKVLCQTTGTSLLLFGNDNLGANSKNFTITNSRFGKFEVFDCHNLYIARNVMGGGFSDFEDCGYFVIERNHFNAAIAFWSSGAAGPSSIFRNNTMTAWETTTFSTTWDWALYLYGTGNIDIIHNTFKCKDIARSIFFSSPGAEVYNNIFYRDNGTVSITTLPYTLQTAAASVSSDYNIFWVVNTNGSDPLGALQATYGLDSHSIQINPNFLTHADSLFWPTNPLVDNFGTAVWSLPIDFYGTPRPPQSDAGAIEQVFPPNAYLGNDTTVCAGFQLGWADFGSNYLWNTGETTSSIQVDSSGTYIVTITNPSGVDSDTIQITVNPIPSAFLPDTVWHCYGDASTLQINQAGWTYLWSNGATDSIATFSGTQTAQVVISDAIGCSANLQVQVIELNAIDRTIVTNDEQCLGQNNGSIVVQVNSAPQPVTLGWAHTASTNDTLVNLAPGVYFLTLTDGLACVVEDSIVIAQGSSYPDINLVDSTYHCFGVPAVLNVFQSGLTYLWSTNETNSSISVPGNQAISVIATNSSGCSDTASTVVVSHPEIQYSVSQVNESCIGLNNGSIQVNILSGLQPMAISWNSLSSNSMVQLNLAPGTYVFSLADSASCSLQDSITIFPGIDLAASIVSPALACENTSIPFLGNSLGTTQNWYVEGSFNSAGSTVNLVFGTTGTFNVEMVASDGVCVDTAATQIEIGAPSASTFSVTTCNTSYTWIDGVNYTASNSTATHILTNVYGCDSIITLNLTMNSASASTDQVSACESFTWMDGNTYTSSNNSAQWILPNAVGCDSVITLDLTIYQPSSGIDVVTACDSFVWIDGNTYTANNSSATFILSNTQGCDSVVTLNLTLSTANAAVIENDPELIGPASANSYQWVDCGNAYAPLLGETTSLFTATANGDYALIVEQNGCIDTSACFTINTVGILSIETRTWSLSPNPTESFAKVHFQHPTTAQIEVLNAMGQRIAVYHIENANETQIELGAEPGVYFVKVRTKEEESVVSVVRM